MNCNEPSKSPGLHTGYLSAGYSGNTAIISVIDRHLCLFWKVPCQLTEVNEDVDQYMYISFISEA